MDVVGGCGVCVSGWVCGCGGEGNELSDHLPVLRLSSELNCSEVEQIKRHDSYMHTHTLTCTCIYTHLKIVHVMDSIELKGWHCLSSSVTTSSRSYSLDWRKELISKGCWVGTHCT